MTRMLRITMAAALLAAVFVPLAASAQPGGPFTAGFQLQNLTGSTANITISYYAQDGTTAASVGDTISANSSKTYFPLSAVPLGFNGSVVVSSDGQLAAIANVLTSDFAGGASYSGFTGGATGINLPLIMKGNFGFSTWFNVQNAGSAAATVNVTYAGTPAPAGGCPETQTIQPGAAKTFDQSANSCLAAGFVGAATLTSTGGTPQPIVATVMQIQSGSKSVLAYNGFTGASTDVVMPLVSTGFFGSFTGIQIQNTGGTATNVTLQYTPSGGTFPGAACSETKSIAAGSSTTFFIPMPAGCGTSGTGTGAGVGFVGSGKVTANSASMPLVAIVNQISTTGSKAGSAYNGVNPANATSNVSFPLIMDRNFGFFTGFSVANVGTSTTNVACTFTGTGAPAAIPSTAVASGAALTAVQLNQATTVPYVGSATCTATGGDAKIAGIVNELQTGSPTTSDTQLTYEGANY